MKVTPNPVEQSRNASLIYHNDKGYVFEGFSVFFHRKLPQFFPQTPVNKLSQEFEVVFIEEKAPEQFTVHDLESFHTYMFDHLLEMYDLNRRAKDVFDGCPVYHCMPRFVFKDYATEAVEVLPMSAVLHHIAGAFQPVFDDRLVQKIRRDENLFHNMSSHMKGQIFVNPSKRPATIRVDLIERQDPYTKSVNKDFHPVLTHIGLRPSVYTFSAKPAYQQAMKKYLRTRHLMSLQGKLSYEDKQKLVEQEANIRKLKAEAQHKRDMVMSVTSRGFYSTTFYPDIVQHAVLLTLACSHVRYHWCLETFEKRIGYSFKNRTLLELALTHPSFRANYGTNSDHTRNALANCGLRIDKARNDNRNSQVDRPSRKRGYENLREVMSMKGTEKAVLSPVHHNERLEFLGDSVIEFITTIHLFYMLTDLDEGALATYRSALVQNKHLAVLAKKIGLDEFMLYSHGPDLCHESDFRHAMANTYEAMMAAVYLDCDLNECDRIFADTLFMDEKEEKSKEKLAWTKLLDHPLKRDNPYGDRHLIPKIDSLQLLTQFEDSIGIKFKHIRVLAKAFTRRCIGYNNLTHGHNQRLEFLGDTVLQLVTTEYLYKHFPNHHEGHLSLTHVSRL
ncbi:hypothetical protein L596_006355 [Steinernema carpocapsae]|uniref:RNase III domain-containing protein n=1 Tax=Steinernema carpocapsae TaxID=34508 RepID=A0A4U8V3X6_STECR|nr:hypothetical protein L596_006355 [Steinernema carpocapsae]